jgi:succinate dehydrogenase hydrophobic anchor subunit
MEAGETQLFRSVNYNPTALGTNGYSVPEPHSGIRKWLSIYATALALLLAFTIGFFLVQGNGKLDSANARFSLGLNLIGSAIFALLFATLTTWVLDRNQRDSIEEIIHSGMDQIAANVSVLGKVYLPLAEYPALDTFGVGFNRALMESIERSRVYDFCGPSPRFVAARLRRIKNCPEQIRVSMIDPRLGASVMRRAADREKWASSAGNTIVEIEKLFREELVQAIVALFDFRMTCPVNVVYTNDLVVYRMELTDDAVFFSWYHGPSSSDKEMPEAAQFGNESLYYRVLRQEMTRRFEVLPNKVSFDSSQTDDDLMLHLYGITGTAYDASDLARMRREYAQYTAGLIVFLQSLGY